MALYLTLFSWLLLASTTKRNTFLNSKYTSAFLIFLFVSLVSITLTQRELYQGDMINYYDEFLFISKHSLLDSLNYLRWEPLFVTIQWLISRVTQSLDTYVIITYLIYVSIFIKAIYKLLMANSTIFVLFAYLNFIFFYDFLLVASRQGFSMMFMLLSIAYLINKDSKPYAFYLSCLATILCHYSSIPVVLVLIILKKKNLSLKTVISIWIFGVVLFVSGLNSKIVTSVMSNSAFLNMYTQDSLMLKFGYTANRLDYLLFSGAVLIVSLLLYRFVIKENKETYLVLIKCYTLINFYFLLLGFIAFSVRISTYSWFMIPLLLWYPVVNQKNRLIILISTLITFAIGIMTTLEYLIVKY